MKKIILLLLFVLAVVSFVIPGITALPQQTSAEDLTQEELTGEADHTASKVLVVRVGFSDYPLSEEESETGFTTHYIRRLFEGGAGEYPYDSIPAYYLRSSYGRLDMALSEIIDVELDASHDAYSGSSGTENEYRLINDILKKTDLKAEDADFVYFLCNGQKDKKGSIWWPHCHREGSASTFEKEEGFPDNYVLSCKDSVNVLIHETGHLLGLGDYYAYENFISYDFNVPDMMSDNQADHNGLSKWIAGWLTDEDISYINRANAGESGVEVHLKPLDSEKTDGKMIAVISPEETSLYGEYLIVEYISGKGNMSSYDARKDYPEGFRIIHVYYDEDKDRFFAAALTKDYTTGADFGVYTAGDSMTPYTVPSSSFIKDGELKEFTGINIRDFVTGEDPKFYVEFSDKKKDDGELSVERDEGSLSNMLELTLKCDRPVKLARSGYGEGFARLENGGEIFPLVLKADEYNSTRLYLEYRELTKPLLPDTIYTLVLPEGMLQTEEGAPVNEIRTQVKTDSFTRLEDIQTTAGGDLYNIRTELLPYKGGSAYIAVTDSKAYEGVGLSFVSFNSKEEAEDKLYFISLPTDDRQITEAEAYPSKDGNYYISLKTLKNTYLQKISEEGKTLSKLVCIPALVDIAETGDVIKGLSTEASGDTKGLPVSGTGEFTGEIWTADMSTGEVSRKLYRYDAYISGGFLPLGDNEYCICGFDRDSEEYYLDLYDEADSAKGRIKLSQNLPLSVCTDGDAITIVEIAYDEVGDEFFLIKAYDREGNTILSKRLNGENLDEMYLSGVRLLSADWGYVLFYRYAGKTDRALSRLMFLNEELDIIGSVSLPGGAGLLPLANRAVVVWEDDEGRSMAWTSVLMQEGKAKDRLKKVTEPTSDAGHGQAVVPLEKADYDTASNTKKSLTLPEKSNQEPASRVNVSLPAALQATSTGDREDVNMWIAIAIAALGICIVLSIYTVKRSRKS